MSEREAKATKIDWTNVDSTTEADIARHARQDRTQTPSDRAWRQMIEGGRVAVVPPATVDVRAIREKLKLSQSEFAARFGFTAAAVRQWEQGRRHPHGPARVLLTIIDREPNAVRRALATDGVSVGPTRQEMLERLRARPVRRLKPSPTEIIRAERDSR
jgi:putative transcriptional regulator